ncbi:MAG: type II secretion system protein N [Nevskiaceae bacterium]
MSKRWIIVLAVVAFLVTLVLHAPAALVYAWTQDPARPAPVRLHGVHGTLARGGFAALSVNDRPALRDANWALQPAWLALLRVTADIEAGDEAVVRARVSRSLFGALQLSRINAAGSVKTLLQMLGQPPLPVEGQARLDLPLLRLDDGLPIEAQGSVEVERLAWTLAREPLALGSFNAALTTDPQGVLASFGSGPGPLEVGGSAVLKPDRSYQLDLQLRPRAGAPEALLTLVRSLGPADGQGWHHLRRQGTLQ